MRSERKTYAGLQVFLGGRQATEKGKLQVSGQQSSFLSFPFAFFSFSLFFFNLSSHIVTNFDEKKEAHPHNTKSEIPFSFFFVLAGSPSTS